MSLVNYKTTILVRAPFTCHFTSLRHSSGPERGVDGAGTGLGGCLAGQAEDGRRNGHADRDVLAVHGARAHRGAVGLGDALRHGAGITGSDHRGQDRGARDRRQIRGGPGPAGGALGLDEARDTDRGRQEHRDDAQGVDRPRATLVPPGTTTSGQLPSRSPGSPSSRPLGFPDGCHEHERHVGAGG